MCHGVFGPFSAKTDLHTYVYQEPAKARRSGPIVKTLQECQLSRRRCRNVGSSPAFSICCHRKPVFERAELLFSKQITSPPARDPGALQDASSPFALDFTCHAHGPYLNDAKVDVTYAREDVDLRGIGGGLRRSGPNLKAL